MEAGLKEKTEKAFHLHKNKNFIEAEKLYNEILNDSPNNPNILNLMGLLNLQLNKPQEAILFLKKASEILPSAYILGNLGRAYFENDNINEAITSYEQSIKYDENVFDTWFNLALAYKKSKKLDDAIIAYEKSLSINPDNSSAYFNLANLYEDKNETLKAIECYEKALKYSPDKEDADIHYFLSTCYLKAKDFEKGLFHHEYRPSKPFAILSHSQLYKNIETKPLWDGSEMKDKTIFVYYESALGDTLLYVRYLHLLKDKFKKILFKPQLCFLELFKENNFGTTIIDNNTMPTDVEFDVHIPLMSLPFLLKQYDEKIILAEGYLKPDADKSKQYKNKYFNTNKFNIGIKWMGNTANDQTRIINIESFLNIFDLPNTQFYSLQKGEGIEEVNKIPKTFNVLDLGKTFNNFSDTAAVIDNLDLVICNDTSIAHLAGAMGKPCWILLPFVQNWRWHTDISNCSWYKSVKLFKQEIPGNWDNVFEKVRENLKTILNV